MGMFYVYMISNAVNGKIYIGYTNDPKERWRSHRKPCVWRKCPNSYLYCSMRKHRIENFSFEIFEEHETKAEALEAEIFWIAYYKSIGAELMNMTDGGDGMTGQTKEIKAKISAALKSNMNATRAPIIATDSNGLESEFSSVIQAARALSITRANISHVLNSRRKRAGGFTFRYAA